MAAPTLAAPRVDTNVCPDTEHFIADASSADVDLTAISKRPNHAAQKCLFVNNTAAALVVKFTPEKSVVRTLSVPAQNTIEYNMPVASITASGSGAVQVIAFYWHKGGLQINR